MRWIRGPTTSATGLADQVTTNCQAIPVNTHIIPVIIRCLVDGSLFVLGAARPRVNAARILFRFGSGRDASNEINNCKTFHHHRWSQDQRQSRGCVLESVEVNREGTRHEAVGPCHLDRFGSTAQQFIFGDPPLRPQLLSKRTQEPRAQPLSTYHATGAARALRATMDSNRELG
jgi:hypothetical protein